MKGKWQSRIGYSIERFKGELDVDEAVNYIKRQQVA
jgi:hypothetical protein